MKFWYNVKERNDRMDTILIIGGGPSGIVASIYAKKEHNRVIVLEKNAHPLKKLLMTGNGKCNYLNEVIGTSFYHSQNIDVVSELLKDQNIQDVHSFFDSIGIVPKIKNGYYYPFSGQATTIQNALIKEAMDRGVEILCNEEVTDILKESNHFIVSTKNHSYDGDKVVLASGSCAVPKTGSDGFGYSLLEQFGHTLVKPLPALVQLTSNHPYQKDWDGVRSDAILELFEDGKYISREEGEVQLTSYGISGICTFNLSHFVTRGLALGKKEEIHINFVPFIDTLVTPWMDQYSKTNSHKNLRELLEGFLNYKIVTVLLKTLGYKGEEEYSSLSNEDKCKICRSLSSFSIEITGTKDFDSCQVCNGGIVLTEIDSHTMESKKVKDLYIVGELLDMNGNCGGYNLTTCWISGILAGRSIGDSCD